MLSQTYGGEAMKKSSVFAWHKWFKEGHENMEDERNGYPKDFIGKGKFVPVLN